MNKKFSLMIIAILSLFVAMFLASCASTPKVIEVKTVEYEPVVLDLDESTQLLYDSRPNLEPTYPDGQKANYYGTLILAYKAWGEEWMEYSFRLEDYIESLKKVLTEDTSDTSE